MGSLFQIHRNHLEVRFKDALGGSGTRESSWLLPSPPRVDGKASLAVCLLSPPPSLWKTDTLESEGICAKGNLELFQPQGSQTRAACNFIISCIPIGDSGQTLTRLGHFVSCQSNLWNSDKWSVSKLDILLTNKCQYHYQWTGQNSQAVSSLEYIRENVSVTM